MIDAARIANIQNKVKLNVGNRIVMWASGVQIEDVVWLLDQIAALTAEVERLTAKLESDECNAGHKTLPLKLWDCPACGAARDAALDEGYTPLIEAVWRARDALAAYDRLAGGK